MAAGTNKTHPNRIVSRNVYYTIYFHEYLPENSIFVKIYEKFTFYVKTYYFI